MAARQPIPPPDDHLRAAAIDAAWAHRDELILYARRLLGAQPDLAEDVVQEAFLRLHQRASADTAVREPRPWLFRVTRNLALDERRRARRGDAVRSALEVVATAPRGPFDVLQAREETRQALEGLDALPPRERRTVILDQAGLAPPAIARRMQTSTNAVHQSLFRARRRLRDARAAAWGLLPLPFIRLVTRAATAPVLERLPALAPGSGGRFAGGAGLAGLVAAAIVGGGAIAERPLASPPPVHRDRATVVESVPGAAPITLAAPAAPARPGRGVVVAVSAPAPVRPPVSRRAAPLRSRTAPVPPPAAPATDRVAVSGEGGPGGHRSSRGRDRDDDVPAGSGDEDGSRRTESRRTERSDRTDGSRHGRPSPEGEGTPGSDRSGRPEGTRASGPGAGATDGPATPAPVEVPSEDAPEPADAATPETSPEPADPPSAPPVVAEEAGGA